MQYRLAQLAAAVGFVAGALAAEGPEAPPNHHIHAHPGGSRPAAVVVTSTIVVGGAGGIGVGAGVGGVGASIGLGSNGHAPVPNPTHPIGGGGGGSSESLPIPTPTSAPTGAPSAGGGGGSGDGGMTIDIVNSWSSDLYVSYGSNAGGPSPVGNPSAGPLGTSTRVVVPTQWAGRVYVGPGPNVDPMGTKVEGSTTGPPDIDVSYVDGYSVPMTCSVNNMAVAGCNIDLYANAKQAGLVSGTSSTGCPGKQVGSVCYNPSNTVTGNGPAPPFFAPCVGAAYTFPNDNVANVGNLPSNHVVCCVGTSCPAPARQGHEPNQPSKRGETANQAAGALVLGKRQPGSGTLLARFAGLQQYLHAGVSAPLQPN